MGVEGGSGDYGELLRHCDRAAFKGERWQQFPRAAAGSSARSC